ncbi:MAG TPA: MFS transporter [Acidimicrobiales bacterium]|nr:MFS transporter [Acidimicrobiales bacterium]
MAGAIQQTFGSLRNHNFRLFFFGTLVSFAGEWMQNMAEAWLVLQLTHNGAAVGATFAFRFAPVLFFGLWGGVVADRLDRRRLMLVTQSLAAVLAFVLWAIVALHVVHVWMIYALAATLGLVVVFDHPARNAFLEEMVGPEAMPNAVALLSAVSNSARITGPAIAAILIAHFGVAWVFFVNGVSFLFVVAALLGMRTRDLLPVHRDGVRARIKDGLRYAWSVTDMRGTIVLLGVIGTLVWNFPTFLTLVAQRTLHGDAGLAGTLMAILGVGSVIGALAAAHRATTSALVVRTVALLLGAAMLATALAPTRLLVMASLVPTGALAIMFGAVANSHMQSLSSREFRGRVMSIYSILGLGTTVVGGPFVGLVSQVWSPRVAMGLAGAAAAITALALFATRPGRTYEMHVDPIVAEEAAT